jgi:hypothetical protein
MTQLLIRALEAAAAGPAEKKAIQNEIVRRYIPAAERELGNVRYMVEGEDGKMGTARELLLSTSIESTTLIQTEISRTVLEGSEPVKCFRDAVPIFKMNAKALQVNIGETGTYAPFVAEGAEVPINTQDYSARTWTAKKIAERPLITQEMVNDSLFSVIELEVRKTGLRVENTLNQWMLQILMDNAGNEHDLAAAISTNGGIVAAINARAELVTDGFIPDRIVTHPAITPYLFKDFVPGYNPVAQQITLAGVLPSIMGCRVFECGVDCDTGSAPTAATQTWGDKTDGNMGMLVFDSKSCGGIGMREDLHVEQYKDPIRDLVGMSVMMRAACQYGVANSICRVEYGG